MTTAEPALPRPLAETGTIRGLGAEVVEYVVGEGDAIAGLRVRELGLPREALVSVIVRGDEAILPRGSTRVEAGDRLHVLVRQEVAAKFPELIERWRSGPMGRRRGRRTRFLVIRRSSASVPGPPPMATLPVRMAWPGSWWSNSCAAATTSLARLWSLEDGRYAVTGSLLIVGSAMQVRRQARKCLRQTDDDMERAWWQEVIGALGGDRGQPPGSWGGSGSR